jgi:threonyl-tRNA synthetase
VRASPALQHTYGIFGFDFELHLSTRPKKAMGALAVWNKAEAMMSEALNAFGRPWKLNPGDGAFYGPKIDIKVFDALGRPHQCATIQLDFQLPVRFNLRYRTATALASAKDDAGKEDGAAAGAGAGAGAAAEAEACLGHAHGAEGHAHSHPGAGAAAAAGHVHSAVIKDRVAAAIARVTSGAGDEDLPAGYERPVIIHRAILGSVERMLAVLIEHTGGKWPFWLSPRQIAVVPVDPKYFAYASSVGAAMHAAGFHADVDTSSNTLNKKVREAQVAQYNFILVVGEKEVTAGTVNIRTRENQVTGEKSLADAIAFFKALDAEFK